MGPAPLPPRKSFQGNLQVAWDSTSLSALMTCPRKYELSILHGYTSRSESVHLIFGTHYHKAMERYHYAVAKARSAAARPSTQGDGSDKQRRTEPSDSPEMVSRGNIVPTLSETERLRIVSEVVLHALRDTAGWVSDNKYKNRQSLIRAIVWALEEYKADPAETVILASGTPAVELSFRFELPVRPAVGGDPFLYCGHLDRLATFLGKSWVEDYKSTASALGSYFFAGFNPNNQMTGYTFGAKVAYHQPVAGVLVTGVQLLTEGVRFERSPTLRTEDQLSEWLANTSFWVKAAESYAAANFWPMNLASCGNYGGCPFRGVCSKSPAQRETWLKADFNRRYWDPLEIRGDL